MSEREEYVFAPSDRLPYGGCMGRGIKLCATKDLVSLVEHLGAMPPTLTPEREAIRIKSLDIAKAEVEHRKALEQKEKTKLPIIFLETWDNSKEDTESKFKGVGWYSMDEASYIVDGPFDSPEEAAFEAGRYVGRVMDGRDEK